MIDDVDDYEMECPACTDAMISASTHTPGITHAHCSHHRRHAARYASSTRIVY
jgi:hypothetical protein